MKKIFLIFLLLLSGCGFQPIFSGQNTDVYVAPIRGINGIDLRNRLNAQFGGQHDITAKYTLNVDLDMPNTQYKGVETTGDATWQQISLTAKYTLTQGDKQIAQGSETASESYTFVRYLVASNASYNNAIQNIIQILADKISTRTIVEISKDAQVVTQNGTK